MRASRIVAAALAICLLPCGASAAEPPLELRSPGGEVAITWLLAPDGATQYVVSFHGREVIAPSLLGLDLGEAGARPLRSARGPTHGPAFFGVAASRR